VRVKPPVVVDEDRFFWDGVQEGLLLLRQCAQCGRLQHPPSPMCPGCGSLEWSVRQMSGRGTVHSWIVSHHPSEPDDVPRIAVLIDLDEGPRFVSNLIDCEPDGVINDMPVEVVFVDVDSVRLPQFRPVSR
jgi:uncharacterized OB-fold protein